MPGTTVEYVRLGPSTTHHFRVTPDDGWMAASWDRREGEGNGSRADATHTLNCGGLGLDFLNFDPGLYTSSSDLQW